MLLFLKLLRLIFIGFFGISVVAGITALAGYLYFAPSLPSVATLKDVELQVPLKVYSQDKKLIAVYGEKRRQPLHFEAFPKQIINAFLAAEDDRFFQHPGVDYQGLIRAAISVLATGEKRQGGSTITMQLARNFFLGNERTYVRKIREILLALRIEGQLSKNEIIELYLNKIYLGNRAYGVGAAADVYYGVDVQQLNIAQIAMIAGLPKAPSTYNPIINPERALIRRNYVLDRMRILRFISQEEFQSARETEVTASRHYPRVEVNAPYIGEMARAFMVETYGADAYNKGLNVYTTIDSELQLRAQNALVNGLIAYDQRHGYRGPETHIELEYDENQEINTAKLDEALSNVYELGGLYPAVVIKVEAKKLALYVSSQQIASLSLEQAKWAKPYKSVDSVGDEPTEFSTIFKAGDIIRVTQADDGKWSLSQIPEVSGAFVAIDPQNGKVSALVGGFDYNHSKFNRVIQAKRQPGSSFKPFIYSAALDSGYTPASIINDAPVVFEDAALEDTWRPQNYSGKFFGPTRLRDALTKSRNMVSIRLMKEIGRRHALQHVTKFGFEQEQLPHDLTLALGSGVVTPLELATGYAVFANGGYYIEPYLVESIEDAKDGTIFQSSPLMVCEEDCLALQKQLTEDAVELFTKDDTSSVTNPSNQSSNGDLDENELIQSEQNTIRTANRVLADTNAYQIVSMMQDVISRGTGKKANVIRRNDLAGKTGTTNDQHDAWFSGFNGDIVATSWVGFDQHRPLGRREVGGIAALPIWIEFMQAALEGKAENTLPQPEGMVTLRIDPKTGLLVDQNSSRGIKETFREEFMPTLSAESESHITYQQSGSEATEVEAEIPEQLF